MKKTLSIYTLLCFLVTSIMGLNPVFAQDFRLPAPGVMINLSPAFNPAVLKGIRLDPKNPFRFHFFVDSGDSKLSQNELKNESSKLIKYFLASLTIPEKDLWVNLSPYEKDRIVPQEFGQTEMGRDLLAEDYILKQITASLIYPDSHLGKEFWQKVYAKAQAKYGTTNIPINTFNKVWIVPEKAVIYENGGVAFVLENHLKVMLEQDYLSLGKHEGIHSKQAYVNDTNQLGSQVVREIVIPALTKEVNEGKNFFQLRQVFYSLILATWYKRKIKDSILNRIYSNQNKIAGLNVSAKDKDKIYQEYLKAFKKGVYNYIKEEPSPMGNEVIPRKYFSGGVLAQEPPLGIRRGIDSAMIPGLEKSHFVYEDVELRMDEAMNVKKNDIAIPEQQLQTFEQALENQARSLGYSVNKDTKFILQLGDTLDKSRYYITFNAALKMGGDNILLLPVKTMPADLERIMRMGRLSTKVIGFNITSPHKINAIQYLDELDEFAISGAVEAVVKQKDGTLKGYNLDGEAWVYWYTQILKKSLQEKKIVVLGAGGAARSIIYSIFSDAPLSHIVVYDRQKGVADTLKNDLGKRNPRDIKVATMSNLNGYIKESDIVINLTGSGKSYDDRNPSIPDIDYNLLNGKLVFDANYRFVYEGAQNEFLKHAKEAGATIFNGLGLSVATIPLNIMLFTGKKSEYQDLIKIAKAPLIEGGAGFQDEAMTTNEI